MNRLAKESLPPERRAEALLHSLGRPLVGASEARSSSLSAMLLAPARPSSMLPLPETPVAAAVAAGVNTAAVAAEATTRGATKMRGMVG